jgi:predicted DNA-binding helix-hairpin-helix protein
MAVRLNVNINNETETALKKLAAKRGTSVTEIVRRAVAIYEYLEDETSDGKKVQLVDSKDRPVTKVAFL